jgi:hypothetical protein
MVSMKATSLSVSIVLLSLCGYAQQGAARTSHDSVAILAEARSMKIESYTDLMQNENLEAELLQQPEFKSLGLELVQASCKCDDQADLVIKVQRSPFTTSFPYSVSNPSTRTILTAGKVNSIGGTVYHKIARNLIKAIQDARAEIAKRSASPPPQKS